MLKASIVLVSMIFAGLEMVCGGRVPSMADVVNDGNNMRATIVNVVSKKPHIGTIPPPKIDGSMPGTEETAP